MLIPYSRHNARKFGVPIALSANSLLWSIDSLSFHGIYRLPYPGFAFEVLPTYVLNLLSYLCPKPGPFGLRPKTLSNSVPSFSLLPSVQILFAPFCFTCSRPYAFNVRRFAVRRIGRSQESPSWVLGFSASWLLSGSQQFSTIDTCEVEMAGVYRAALSGREMSEGVSPRMPLHPPEHHRSERCWQMQPPRWPGRRRSTHPCRDEWPPALQPV
jgi:hypothetical protein